jgi:hypothetical protein
MSPGSAFCFLLTFNLLILVNVRYDGVPGRKYVDIVRDVINATAVDWAAEKLVMLLLAFSASALVAQLSVVWDFAED